MIVRRHFITCAVAVWALLWGSGLAMGHPPFSKAPTQPQAIASSAPVWPVWLDLGAEYRVRGLYVNPFDLSGELVRESRWVEQRLRMDLGLKNPGIGAIRIQVDALDGVLFGDNGVFGGVPAPNTGVKLTSKQPNHASWTMGLLPGADPLSADSYVPTLSEARPLHINHLYMDVNLPFGLFRVGRQPTAMGANITIHDGGRHNRWGVSQYSNVADRVLVATKLDEAVRKLSSGPDYKVDTSLDRGVFLGLFYDWISQGSVHNLSDDLTRKGVSVQWKQDVLGSGLIRDIFVSANLVHMSDQTFATEIWATPLRAQARVGDLSLMFQYSRIVGETREISEGFALLSNKEPQLQDLKTWGAQGIIDYRLGPVTLTFEVDYATGDDDPRSSNPIETFSFARDVNVGLLLFEHIMAFESARSVAAGVQNLANLDAPSFPLTEVQTDGRFTNAVAIFPQLKIDWMDRPKNKLHTRFGVLMAWPQAGGGVVDPIATILAEDGNEVSDDAVNFHGGDPGDYYGTEIDVQLQWVHNERFFFTLEGAVLFPGSSLLDEHGHGVNSFFVESRFLYVF